MTSTHLLPNGFRTRRIRRICTRSMINSLSELNTYLIMLFHDLHTLTTKWFQNKADSLDLYSIDKRIDKMMPSLGFTPEDNDRLVSFHDQ